MTNSLTLSPRVEANHHTRTRSTEPAPNWANVHEQLDARPPLDSMSFRPERTSNTSERPTRVLAHTLHNRLSPTLYWTSVHDVTSQLDARPGDSQNT